MASADATAIADQAGVVADYDALRDLAARLAGLLVAREGASGSAGEAAAWQQERRALLARLDQIQPGTPAVSEALGLWGARLAELCQDAM